MKSKMLGKAIGNVLDASAVATLLGVVGEVVTVWASLWTIVWLSVRLYESRTFARIRDWFYGKRDKGNYDYGEHPPE